MTDENEKVPMQAAEKIIVALDTDAEQARALAEQLIGKAHWLKIGMTLFYNAGPSIVQEFKDMGYKVFVDLKLHDIPHQVRGAARAVTAAGADMLTVHASGGMPMMQAAYQGVEEGWAGGFFSSGKRPICLAITVLTSLNAEMLESIGVSASPATQALRLANLAKAAGMYGIVCSPEETAAIRREVGEGFVLVTPGVRPAGSELGDQARTATPKQALEAGADYLVIGRPITEAEDPCNAFDDIVKQMS